MSFLKGEMAEDTSRLSENDLYALSWHSYFRGRELGLRRKSSLLSFAMLALITDGDALADATVARAISDPNGSPHAALGQIFETIRLTLLAG